MPDIRSLVKKMIADGESEDVIKAVIKKMDATEDGSDIKSGLPDMSPEPPPKDEYRGPDTFWGGVKNSLFGKEFDETARKSLKGFAKGTADIPTTLADTAQGFASGIHSLIQDPAAHFRAMPEAFREMGRGIRDVTKNAGADPEAFGHLSGQLFGQPAFIEGLVKAPAIASSTSGAINRIPAVNKTLSSIGSKLEGTRQSNYVPSTSRGLIAGAVRGVARPVGRVLSRVGERGRLDAGTRPPSSKTNIKLKGETETPHSPDSDIFAGGGQGATRPRIARHDTPDLSQNSEFTRPVLETAEELAARKRPSAFSDGPSSRYRHRPYEQGQEAAAIAENAGKPKTSEVPQDTFEPSVDPAKNFSFEDLQTMKTRRDEVNAILRKMAEENDVDPTTGEISPAQVDRTFPGLPNKKRTQGKWGITRPDEGAKFADNVNEEMGYFGGEQNSGMINDAGIPDAPQRYPGDEAFDLGEISPGFRQTPSMPNWGPETINSPRPVNPLRPEVPPGQVSNRRMFELSEQRAAQLKAQEAQQFNDSIGHEFDQDMMLTPNELTQPDVPKFTSPFENQNDPRISGLAPRGDAPDILGGASPSFKPASKPSQVGEAVIVGGEDALPGKNGIWDKGGDLEHATITEILPDGNYNVKYANGQVVTGLHPKWIHHPDVVNKSQRAWPRGEPMLKPGQILKFDEEIPNVPIGEAPHVPIGEAPDVPIQRTIQPEEWGDWGGLEKDIPTLVPDETGSHVAAPNEEMGFSGKQDPGIANDDPFKGMTNNKSRLVKTPKEPNFPSVIPEGFEKVTGNKPGPAGAAYRITDPNGKHLGDINVTPKDIAEVKKMNDGALADVPDEALAKELYKNRLEAMLAQHGFSPDDAPRMKIDAMDNRLKKSGPTPLAGGEPTFSTTKKTEEPRPLPANFGTDKLGEAVSFPNDTFSGSVGRPGLSGRGQLDPKPSRFKAKAIDPNEAFARGGDIGPIVQEAAKLMFDNAVDSKFRSLLPEQMRGPLGAGETYQGKLKRLIEEIEGEYSPEQGAQRYAEMEAFNDSLRGYSRNPIDIPPLDPRSVDVSKLRPGKLNQQKPWVSPRAQQKYKRSLDDVKKNKK